MSHSSSKRRAIIERSTAETSIQCELNLDGSGEGHIQTGIPFFDHMLILLARHSLVDLTLHAKGDIDVDFHHTVEDTGIVLGQAWKQALADKRGIRRYGCSHLPMDETLSRVVVDFSGRPCLVFQAPDRVESIREFSFQLVEEFFRAFSTHAAINLHASVLYGKDAHHMAESLFKGLARALDEACRLDPRVTGIPSTKGVL